MSNLFLGNKGAICSLPQKTSRWKNEGPEIPGLSTGTSGLGPELPVRNPEYPVVRKFLEQNLRCENPDPLQRENAKTT